MTGVLLSSGDLAADRRAAFAESMAHLGDLPAAVEILQQALALAPNWHAGWFRMGEYLKAAGALDEAAEAWGRAIEADPSDPLGASINRDLIRPQPISESMPSAFVEMLFDQYAPRFETSLCDKLEYRGPELLLEAMQASGLTQVARALDLGCGTGLMGALLRPYVDHLEGCDISQGMLSEAAAKGDYDTLEKRDIATMERTPDAWDLIVAADVFIYLGALEQVIGWCVDALRPGGMLAFTIELGDAPVRLRETRRFAHSLSYIEGLLADAGFGSVSLSKAVLRKDRGADVHSLIVTARRASLPLERSGDEEMALAG
ncbi:methyltransferase [Sagittula sp. S175]|uniref:class I SAM-dependent DNA methyltransferase n=1 Tax=Sagittula sp. S175 TaxID=3415129 RepID=UPI003C7B96DD